MWSTTSSVLNAFNLLFLILFAESFVSDSGVSNQTNKSGPSSATKPLVVTPYAFGGVPTKIDEFPFMAALGWVDENGNIDFLCGGALISSDMVLTAAHCAYYYGKIPDVVRIGGQPLSHSSENLSVASVTVFPQYDPNQAYYDIALFRLESNATSRPICLWTKPNLYINHVTAMGYGLTQFAGEKSDKLLKVNLTVFPQSYCEQFFKRQRRFKNGLSHAHVCAGDANRKMDTCQGDSGGPLIVVHRNRTYAVGITSTGQACHGFPPAIYTKISSYIGWINEVFSEHGYRLGRECPY